MNHPTKHEMIERLSEVTRRMMIGQRRSEIHQFLTETYGVTRRTADRYMQGARGLIARDAATDRRHEIALAKARLDQVYGRALDRGDMASAVAAIREKSKLLGLNEPERHEHEHRVEFEQALARAERILGVGCITRPGGN